MKRRRIEFAVFGVCISLLVGMSAQVKPASPGVQQKAERSACSNIVALTGNVDLHCGNLTQEQAKAILQTRDLLKKMLAGQVDVQLIQQMDLKLNELLSQRSAASIAQGNSGGLNIQQATTGANSPIINSPINIGLQKTIPAQARESVVAFLRAAPTKSKISVTADQYSDGVPFPQDIYDAFKEAGWPLDGNGVNAIMAFYAPGPMFRGAIVSYKGSEPVKGEASPDYQPSDPMYFVTKLLVSSGVNVALVRKPTIEDGVISIHFRGGFPDQTNH